mgnify:CR=1 FL=1
MNTKEVRDMFRSYTDEADTTFLTDAQITLYLSEGYSDFRRTVCDIDPFIYSIEHLFDLTSSNEYDLAATPPQLLGPTAGTGAVGEGAVGTKLERLLRVARINDTTNNDVIQYLDAAPSERTMNLWCYTFIKSKIIMSGLSSGAYRLEYVPFHGIDFSVHATGRYIDDLDGFHDMIPLYAYSRYAIRDGADNPQLQTEIANKRGSLISFLESGRNREGSQYVTPYDNWY